MGMDLFAKICSDYYNIGGGTISLCSMQSDAFSDPNLFSRLNELEKFKDKFYLYATTNFLGAAALSDDELEYFLRQFSLLQISMGGPTKQDYKAMFGADAFDVVSEQLERALFLIRGKSLPTIIHMYFRVIDVKSFEKSSVFEYLDANFITREVRNHFFSWGGLISRDDLPAGTILHVFDNVDKTEDCAASWATLSVLPDGRVSACGCGDWRNEEITGDLTRNTIKEIWQSENALRFRQGFSNKKIPGICIECSLYTSANESFKRNLADYNPRKGLYYNYNF
jgi:radical SAM protein with 4Fe4S-binding SPASM domain